MKNSLPYILVLAIIFIVYQFLNPKVITETKTEYIKGDTVTVIKEVPVKVFIKDTITKVDSFFSNDSTVSIPYTKFKLGNDSVNVIGQVAFFDSAFSFKDAEIKYVKEVIINTVTDTLTKTITIDKPKLFFDSIEFGFGLGAILTTAIFLFFGK